MEITSSYTECQTDATLMRKGGLILRGQTRTTRQPIHMILMVDTSGSMELEEKLTSVKRSITLMLGLLSPDDRISLVTFADDSKIILSRVAPTPQETDATRYRIDTLRADGSTNMSAGLLDARSLVEDTSSGRKQGILLLTDGHANVGVYTEDGLLSIVERIQTECPGVSVTTVAYGVDHNADMLTSIAKKGGGAYNVVKNLEDVATVFGDILGGLVSVSAQKVEIQLPPGAEPNTKYRFERHPSGLTKVYIGDIYAEAEIVVLFKNAPSNGPIRVTGMNMTTLDPIDTVIEPNRMDSTTVVPIPLLMADYTLATSKILDRIAHEQGEAIRAEITALVEQIEQEDRIRDHPLKAMLLEDLTRAKDFARRQSGLTQTETVEFAQHSAFLSMARGLRTTVSHSPPATPNRGMLRQRGMRTPAFAPVTSLAAVTSPFANRLQTQYSQAMASMSSQVDPEESPSH